VPRCAQLCGCAWNCAFRDCLSIFSFLQPKLSQITQTATNLDKRNLRSGCGAGSLRLQTKRSRAAHVGAGTRVDLDHLAFLDEKRDVDGHAGLERRRLGNIARRVAAQSLRGLGYLQAYRRG